MFLPKLQFHDFVALKHPYAGATVQNPIGARPTEFWSRHRGCQPDHPGAGSFSGSDSSGNIFHHNAIGRGKTEPLRGFQIRLGMRLPMGNVGRCNQSIRKRKPGCAQTNFGERPGRRGNDGPAARGKSGKEFERAGQWNYAFDILNLTALDLAILGLVICLRQVLLHRGEAGTPVGAGDDFVGIESAIGSPAPPDTGNGRGRVDENAVHVEEKGGTVKVGRALGHGTLSRFI